MKIKFCGGCNPLYDRKKVYEKLLNLPNFNNIERLIVLNGCQRSCKTFEPSEINSRTYILENLNKKIDEEKIYEWILTKL